MDNEYIILLKEYSNRKSSVVNDFLNETGLCKDFRLVLAEYTIWAKIHGPPGGFSGEPRLCLGLEALNEQCKFYWQLKGHDAMVKMVDDYVETKKFNEGVS